MSKQTNGASWHQIEEQAFHAYREWHLWLILRERELAQQIASNQHKKSGGKHDEINAG